MGEYGQVVPLTKIFPFRRNHQLNTDLENNRGERREPENNSNGGRDDLESYVEEGARDLKRTAKTKSARPLDYLPGHPPVKLKDTSFVFRFLVREFCNDDIDRVAGEL